MSFSSNRKGRVSSNFLEYREVNIDSERASRSMNSLVDDLMLEERKKKSGLCNYILQTFTKFKLETTIFWSYMIVLTSCYLWSETLQSSSLITSDAHNDNTTTAFGYDLIIAWLVSYFLLNQQSLFSRNIPDNIFYWVFAHFGALGFALLGEVPFLKHLAIVKDFWKSLTPAAWCTILFFGSIIVFIGIRELIDSCRNKTIKSSLINILLVSMAYGYMFYILKEGDAKDIHYHIHHAIFSGVLSLWFTNWDNCWEMFMNAILLGIVVEGINFYGVGELFLFLTKNTTEMTYHNSVLISCLFTFVLLLLYIVAFLINRI